MSSYDITFCSKENCKNMDCKRNLKHLENIPYIKIPHHPITVSHFKKCEFWEEKNG